MINGSDFGYAASDLAKARQEAAKQSMGADNSQSEGEDVLGTGLGVVGGIIGAIVGGPPGAAAGWGIGNGLGKAGADLVTNHPDQAGKSLMGIIPGALSLIPKKKPQGPIDPTAGAGDEVPDAMPDTGAVQGLA